MVVTTHPFEPSKLRWLRVDLSKAGNSESIHRYARSVEKTHSPLLEVGFCFTDAEPGAFPR